MPVLFTGIIQIPPHSRNCPYFQIRLNALPLRQQMTTQFCIGLKHLSSRSHIAEQIPDKLMIH
jgi:hypothetical protein